MRGSDIGGSFRLPLPRQNSPSGFALGAGSGLLIVLFQSRNGFPWPVDGLKPVNNSFVQANISN
jgi:hypothetical protein